MGGLTRDVVTSAATYAKDWLAFQHRYHRVPGTQAAVLLDDELLLSEAYGLADVDAGAPMTTDTLFRIASHSKTFTATAVMQLVEAGRLRLDDPLGAWVDFLGGEDAPPIAAVTVREALAHAGGVVRDGHAADYWQLVGPFPDHDRLREIALDQADVTPRNVRFKYSNIAYSLLGLVIGAAADQTYHDVVTTGIVDRLGLRHTGPELDGSRIEEYACGYSALEYAADRVRIDHVDTRAMASATGFFSTAEDLCRYAAAHFLGDERLLSDDSKRVLQHEVWTIDGVDEGAYGLGFAVQTVGRRRLLGHSGGYPGHITRTVFDPTDRLAVSVLTNAIDGPAEELAHGVVSIVDLAAAQEPDPADGDLSRFEVRLANLWGVQDVVLLGGRLVVVSPASATVTASATLAVEDESTLRVVSGRGYGAVGETLRYTFDGDRVVSVSGPGGLTWWPLGDYVPDGRIR